MLHIFRRKIHLIYRNEFEVSFNVGFIDLSKISIYTPFNVTTFIDFLKSVLLYWYVHTDIPTS